MKKIYFLLLFLFLGQISQADIIVDPKKTTPAISFKIINLKDFPEYHFFTQVYSKGNIKDKRLKSPRESRTILPLSAIHKNKTRFESSEPVCTAQEIDSIQESNTDLKYVIQITKHLKITKIEDGKVYFKVEKVAYGYNTDNPKIQKGSLSFDNYGYGLVSILALLVFVWILRTKKV